MARSSLLRDGTQLSDRYRIVKQIGQGGFGRTYLAEDIHRYNEYCVLKEFAPLVTKNEQDLQKAEALFEREAGILYQLKHNQIPRFEALLKTRIESRQFLFLVQEYIPGDSYWDLLKNQGTFTPGEVTELLRDLLPVLEYIHEQDLIHRDISPDNLIRRADDGKPVLIDFGCVKLAANAVSQASGQYMTMIGKKGYSPEEQMIRGKAFPSSDFYSLAVTILVLLTGKLPDELYDSEERTWKWQSLVVVSPNLAKILNKMLAYHPEERYTSAAQIQKALKKESNLPYWDLRTPWRMLMADSENHHTREYVSSSTANYKSYQDNIGRKRSDLPTNLTHLKTQVVRISGKIKPLSYLGGLKPFKVLGRGGNNISPKQWTLDFLQNLKEKATGTKILASFPFKFTSSSTNVYAKHTKTLLIILGLVTLPGIASFSLVTLRFLPNEEQTSLGKVQLNQQEQTKQKYIYQRVQALKLDSSAFYAQVDRLFYERYPNLKGVTLTENVEHSKYRQIWYEIAENLLEKQ